MIGFYNYTEFLTYLSAISAGLGILISLNGSGHPYLGVFFLMFSGLCDAFDGKVARTKKDRSVRENKFGIQIDSLSDIIAFGVLPACIGDAMIRVCPKISEIPRITKDEKFTFPTVIFLFVSKIKVPKPGMKGILIFIGIGMIEFVALIVASLFRP